MTVGYDPTRGDGSGVPVGEVGHTQDWESIVRSSLRESESDTMRCDPDGVIPVWRMER